MPTPDEIAAFLAALPKPKEKDASAAKAVEMVAQNRARPPQPMQPTGFARGSGAPFHSPQPAGYVEESIESLKKGARDVYQGAVETFGPQGFGERYREAPVPQSAESGSMGRVITGPALRAGYSLATSPAATMLGEAGAATGFSPLSSAPPRGGSVPSGAMAAADAGRAAEGTAERIPGRAARSEHVREMGGVLPKEPLELEESRAKSLGAQASWQTAGQTGFPTTLQAPAPTKQQAAQLAATLPPGAVNRDVLRPLENIFHRLEGAHSQTRLEVQQNLKNVDKGGLLHSPTSEYLYRYGEGDPNFQPISPDTSLPGPTLPPGLQSVWDQHIQPWRARQYGLWDDVKKLRKGMNLNEQERDQLEFLNPNWMHRRTIASVEKLLGRGEEDPTSAVRLGGAGKASSEHARKLFSLVSEKDGSRHLAYLDDNRNLFRVSKTYPDGKLIATRQHFADKDFRPGLGSRINLRGQAYRMQDAYTREIEDLIPDVKYAKDAFVSTRLNVMELQKVKDALLAQREVKQFLTDNRLLSGTRHEGWIKADNYPGLSGLYTHPRISAVLERWGPYAREGADVYDKIRRAVRGLVHSLFWNPLIHGANVAAHAFIQRGLRNFNPVADVKYLGHFAKAWHDVAHATPDYMTSLRSGARLLYGNQIASFERMNDLMFKGLKDLQETPEGKGILTRLNKMTGIPIKNLIKTIYRVSGDALWFGGDILLQAAIREERANLSGPRRSETLAQTIQRIHKEIPSYRIPTEELLPGTAGQTISQLMRQPASNAVLLFMPYHENVMRGMAMQAEDIMRGFTRIKSPAARQDAVDALGKVIVTGMAIGYVYPQLLDPAAKEMFGDKFEMRRFGPFSILGLAMDYFSGKHLSPGAGFRALSGGFYSPSPLIEIPFNLFGAHAYSGSALQPNEPPFRNKSDWQSVPWSERLGTAATSITPVTGQIRDLLQGGLSGIPERLPSLSGFASYRRQTEEERAAEKRRNYADPAYREMVRRNKEKRKVKKPSRFSPVE